MCYFFLMKLASTRMNRLQFPEIKRRFIRFFFLCSLLSGSLQPSLPASQDPDEKKAALAESYTDADAYRIYAIMLEGEKHSSFVIQAETDSWEKVTPDNLDIKGNSKFMKLWGAALRDFAAKDRTAKILGKNIPLTAAYEIVPQSAITSLFKHEQGWTTFAERYPLVNGYYTFSPVGFNPQRTRALVWMTYACGGLCGYARYHFLEKSRGRWREVTVKADVGGLSS
jgi:hypothetical protein